MGGGAWILFTYCISHYRLTSELLLKGYLFKKDHMKVSVFKMYQVGCVQSLQLFNIK